MFKISINREHFTGPSNELRKRYPRERFVGQYIFTQPEVVLQDLTLIKKVTLKDFNHFHDRKSISNEDVEPFFAKNLFNLRGHEWQDMRSTLSPAFAASKIKPMIPFMEDVGKQATDELLDMISKSTTGSIEVDVKDLTLRIANDVIASCVFGLNVNSVKDKDNEFYKMGKMAATSKWFHIVICVLTAIFPFLAKVYDMKALSRKSREYFTSLVLGAMKDREANRIVREDMIHLLMEARKGRLTHDSKIVGDRKEFGFATVPESPYGRKTVSRAWSPIDIVSQAVMFLISGYETISITLSFALHELALNPEIQERLVREIKQHHTRNGGRITFRSIQNMTYLDMVVSETLRLWPSYVQLGRMCIKDYNMGKPNPRAPRDLVLRRGDVLTIPVLCIHRDPKLFPNPEKFDPERFSEENKNNFNTAAYMPFGVGPRNCIGSRFALCEIKVLLCQLLLGIEVSTSKKTCVSSKLSTKTFGLQLKDGHWLMLKARP
ncbi:unnamed protein product [Euphydryas editha]|nr:unnamed protein product [Euphydryas editha]